jgi:hypothetical protein
MMYVGLIRVDLPEPSHLLPKLPEPQARQEAAKGMVALHLLFERHLCAGKKTHCDVGFSDCSEATSAGIAEVGRY